MSDELQYDPDSAFVKFDKQTYISGMWIFDYPSLDAGFDRYLGNVCATLYRASATADWQLRIIQRTYVDDRVFGSEDRKQYFSKTYPADTGEATLIPEVDKNLRGLFYILTGDHFTYLKVHGDIERWMEVAKLEPRLHMATLPKETTDEHE